MIDQKINKAIMGYILMNAIDDIDLGHGPATAT